MLCTSRTTPLVLAEYAGVWCDWSRMSTERKGDELRKVDRQMGQKFSIKILQHWTGCMYPRKAAPGDSMGSLPRMG